MKLTPEKINEMARAHNSCHDYKFCLAIDFDNTLCKSNYPDCGEPIEPIVEFIKAVQSNDELYLTLYTCRHGKALQDAINWCVQHGIGFDFVNENAPDRIAIWGDVRKISCDILIDDTSWGFDINDYKQISNLS